MPRSLSFMFLSSLWLVACVRVPGPHPDDTAEADASADAQLPFDAGPLRPEAGEPYRGPECDQAPPAGAGAGAGGQSSAAASDAGNASVPHGGSGGAAAGAHPITTPGGAGSGGAGSSASEMARVPHSGEIVITEIMSNPAAVRDDAGEWFELHNPGAHPLALGGCTVDDGAATAHPIGAAFTIDAGAYVVVGRGPDAGFMPDVILSFSLGNSADTLALICDGQEIDRVSYGPGFPLAAGASMSLDPSADARANDDAAVWCLATHSFGPDRGTPGAANPACDDGADAGL